MKERAAAIGAEFAIQSSPGRDDGACMLEAMVLLVDAHLKPLPPRQETPRKREAMNAEPVIRVMIVDDHALVRSGLEAFLLVQKDLKLVAQARNGQQAVALCAEAQPDVALMDLLMPGMSGIETIQQIKRTVSAHPMHRSDQFQGSGTGTGRAASRGNRVSA